MPYAKVVVGLPVEGPFDYALPAGLEKMVKKGSRVRVSFGARRIIGYVIGLARQSKVKNTKPILELIDAQPLLSEEMLSLARELADYYCCSWGEAIEAAIPQPLRKGKELSYLNIGRETPTEAKSEVMLLHDLGPKQRWENYFAAVKEAMSAGKGAVMLFSDINTLLKAKEKISTAFTDIPLATLYRGESAELREWSRIREGKIRLVLGTRSAVFAPLNNLGLVIIDDEDNPVYKQEQSPHYHARQVALMRARLSGAKVVLASAHPSLESLSLARGGKIGYQLLGRRRSFPAVKTTRPAFRQKGKTPDILSRFSTDLIARSLAEKKKILIFANRKGFATAAYCHNCGVTLKCPRCNINLVYHFQENLLLCHYCSYRIAPPQICANCNAGYIRYSGAGVEKIESEVARIFPQARVRLYQASNEDNFADTDILVATQQITKAESLEFGLVVILATDNSLNLAGLRAAEYAFGLFWDLCGLTEDTVVIETRLARQPLMQALVKADPDIFYKQELKERKALRFSPYKHLALVRLRGANEAKAKSAGEELFQELSAQRPKNIEVLSINPAQPLKKRGKFCWQVLLRAAQVSALSHFLKNRLKKFSRSGIIVSVDIDPI
jgi:primosomal protein N' (replication factor Y)